MQLAYVYLAKVFVLTACVLLTSSCVPPKEDVPPQRQYQKIGLIVPGTVEKYHIYYVQHAAYYLGWGGTLVAKKITSDRSRRLSQAAGNSPRELAKKLVSAVQNELERKNKQVVLINSDDKNIDGKKYIYDPKYFLAKSYGTKAHSVDAYLDIAVVRAGYSAYSPSVGYKPMVHIVVRWIDASSAKVHFTKIFSWGSIYNDDESTLIPAPDKYTVVGFEALIQDKARMVEGVHQGIPELSRHIIQAIGL